MKKTHAFLFPSEIATAMVAAFLVGSFAVGCSKKSGETAQDAKLRQQFSVPANIVVKDLGAVELSPHTPRHFDLGGGKDCVATSSVRPDGTLQVDLAIISKAANGATEKQQSRLICKPGTQSAISVGDLMISMTPTVKAD